MGVDPGVRGGIAVLNPSGGIVGVWAFKPDMAPREAVEVVHQAAGALKLYGGDDCFMEKVGQIRGDGAGGAFTFGRIVGILEGALFSNGLDPYYVVPVLWQSKLNCLSGGNKNVTKKKALELFPEEKITHSIADALLIAEYGRRRLLL